jgi:hypothetical protein
MDSLTLVAFKVIREYFRPQIEKKLADAVLG